jgi:hypothetical protein
MNTISMHDFFNLESVKTAQAIQKTNAYGSELHRNAFITIGELAVRYGVSAFFETLESYDLCVN